MRLIGDVNDKAPAEPGDLRIVRRAGEGWESAFKRHVDGVLARQRREHEALLKTRLGIRTYRAIRAAFRAARP